MNSRLYEAIEQAIIIPEQMELSSAVPTDHIFSDDYNKRMQKLIKRQKKTYYPLICTSARRVACVIAAFFIMSMTTVLSVEALRKPFFDFIIGIFTDHSEVKSIDSRGDYPDKIENNYEITADISEYSIVYSFDDDVTHQIDYQNNDSIIYFSQIVVNEFNYDYNTQDAEIEHLTILEYEAIGFLDNNNFYNLIWNNGDYIIDISSNIDKDALIEVAKSVKKAEN